MIVLKVPHEISAQAIQKSKIYLCLLVNFGCLSSADFFQNYFQKILSVTSSVSNSLDPYQSRHFVRPDLDSNYLQRSEDNCEVFETRVRFICHFLSFMSMNNDNPKERKL